MHVRDGNRKSHVLNTSSLIAFGQDFLIFVGLWIILKRNCDLLKYNSVDHGS